MEAKDTDRPEKLSMFLLALGFVVGAIGAALTFFWSPNFLNFFYLGFLIVIIGFAIAVLNRLKEGKEP